MLIFQTFYELGLKKIKILRNQCSFFIFFDNLRFKIKGCIFCEEFSIHFVASSHSKSPNIFDLSAHVKINFCDNDSITGS